MDEKLPVKTEQEEEERTWRDVAQSWKKVGKEVKELGERLSSAFREGWETDAVTDEEARRLADRLKQLGEKMARAVDSVREEAKDPDTRAKAKQTMKSTRAASTDLLGELQETLTEGFAEVNKRVDDLVKKRKARKAGKAGK